MSAITIFYQECPVCGRNLRIPAKYFGRQMSCAHCKGKFQAGKGELPDAPKADSTLGSSLLPAAVFGQAQLGEV